MENIKIEARNNLKIPVRLTLTNVGTSTEDTRILITIGEHGVKLSSFYGICIDTDLPPIKDWTQIGTLNIETKSKVSLTGLKEEDNDNSDTG